MIDYLFYNQKVSEQFVERVLKLGLRYQQSIDPMQSAILIKVDEESLSDEQWDALDELHDELSLQDQAMVEQADDQSSSTSGVYIQLSDGRQTIAKLSPELLNRVLSVMDNEEFSQMIDVIVAAVEYPDDSAICHTPTGK